jgi:anti-sigma factor RsiW
MIHPNDVSDADLDAYIDDQLTPARRIVVEDHLARHPDLAARMMADLRGRDELRLAMAADTAPPLVTIATQDAARRLESGLRRGLYFAKFRRAAAIAVLIGVGWVAHVEFKSMEGWTPTSASAMPAYVSEAARAHRTVLLRASMHSQTVQPNYDRDEIRSATAIGMPDLPEGWKVLDVQIFPSSNGPAVEMAVQVEELGTLSLFAVHPGQFDVLPATVTSGGEVTAAYWQTGEVAYALVGAVDSKALNAAAAKLAATLR